VNQKKLPTPRIDPGAIHSQHETRKEEIYYPGKTSMEHLHT